MRLEVVDGFGMHWFVLTPSPFLTGAGEGGAALDVEALYSDQMF